MYRELFEEVGLSRKDVRILASTRNWLRYKLPKRLVRWDTKPVCIGQKQKWFLLQLIGNDADINMQTSSTPEFDGWRWVSYWYPVRPGGVVQARRLPPGDERVRQRDHVAGGECT